MIRLMLVDDERDVREGVLNEIDWELLGFEVMGTAENGKEAVELLDRFTPDVVVTDICMPFMDGLALSEYIRKEQPLTKIIILTGMDEFEYAQQAVKLHINEYLLKPFSSRELIDVLLKVKQEIHEETHAAKNLEKLREHYEQSVPVLQQAFLSSLLSKQLTLREIGHRAVLSGLRLEGEAFLITVVRMDAPPEESSSLVADKALHMFAIGNITEEIVTRSERGSRVFMHGADIVVLSGAEQEEASMLLQRAAATAEEIRRAMETYLRCTVTIGIGTPVRRISEMKDAYESAIRALDYQLIAGNNRIIQISDIERSASRPDAVRFDEWKQRTFISCLKVGSRQELAAMVEAYFLELAGQMGNVQDGQLYLLELVTAILRAAKDAGVALEQVLETDSSLFAQFTTFCTFDEAKRWMLEMSENLRQKIAMERQTSQKAIVEQAKMCIKRHYADSELGVQRLCEELHISPGYFSSLFKKETKTTFVAYLQAYRLDMAKELLRSTDLKAFEIAERVGYADPNYFSFAFKKVIGISPKEFRNAPGRV